MNVVILGGGTAGTRVANGLIQRAPGTSVTVVDSHGDHLYQPGFLYVPFGIAYPLSRDEKALLHADVRLRVERVEGIDPASHRIQCESGTSIEYDALVIATGSRIDWDALPGMREAGHHFHCRKSAERLRDALALFDGGKIVVGAARLPYKCPPSPIEFALLLDEWLRDHRLREHAEIFYVYPLPRVMTFPSVADTVDRLFVEKEIRSVTSFEAKSIDPEKRLLHAGDGRRLPFDLLALVPPHCGAPFLRKSGLAGEGNWVEVDRHSLRVREAMYALGDAANLPVPKSGAAAHFQSDVVVENVLAELAGRVPSARYDGHVQCFCETGGGKSLRIEFDYAHPPERPEPSYLAHHQKALLNRFYFDLIPRGWI